MLRLARSLAALLLVTLAASAVTPCTEPVTGVRSGAPASSHAHAVTGAGDGELAGGGWCHGSPPPPELKAVCGCGCNERPTAGGVPTGFGWALLPEAPALPVPPIFRVFAQIERPATDLAPEPIEHVPLAV